jgi:hypothetical protein
MNEPDVIAVLAEVRNNLTERGIRKSDDAAVLEQKGGAPEAVTRLRDAAMVDLEAARRIRELEPPVRRQGKRGPKPGTSNGNVHSNGHPEPNAGPATPSGISSTNTPVTMPTKWGTS